MKNILIAFSFALLPLLSMAQTPDFHKNLMFLESYEGEDTLQFLMSAKTKEFKVMDGRFDVLKNGNTIITGAYKDDLKVGKWLFYNDDMTVVDSYDYSIIHNIPVKDYEKIYYKMEEGLQCPNIGKLIEEWDLRFPQIAKATGIGGNVSYEFILNSDNQITNVKILREDHPYLVSDVLYAILTLEFPYSCTFKGKPVNYKITGGVSFEKSKITISDSAP